MPTFALLTQTCFCVAMLSSTLIAETPPAEVSPRHLGPPQDVHSTNNRGFQGIPSFAISPEGRMWATWYAGITPGEDQNNYVVLSTSGDGGKSWEEVMVVDPDGDGPVRAFDPELWLAPNGTLYWFWAQAVGHAGFPGGVWAASTSTPEIAKAEWSAAKRINDGVMMCKPLALSTGEWVLPTSLWRTQDNSAQMMVSEDQGATWKVRGACNVPQKDRQFDEHMLIERKDGSLWMLARTNYGIGESVSTDRGKTWPDLTPSKILHPSARFFIRRLKSGHLLLVKHGPIDKRIGRSHLTAYLSTDEGQSWSDGLMLDERGGVSYPDGQQTSEGVIHIIYDYSRTGDRHILLASFREEDVIAGVPVSGHVRLRQIVSDADGGVSQSKK